MDVAAGLLGISVICFFLIGPVGPCGPSTPWGFLAMLIAFAGFIAAWVVSIVALIAGLIRRQTRVMLLVPVAIATTLSACLAFFLKRPGSGWTSNETRWLLFSVWPLSVAVVHALRDRLQPATA